MEWHLKVWHKLKPLLLPPSIYDILAEVRVHDQNSRSRFLRSEAIGARENNGCKILFAIDAIDCGILEIAYSWLDKEMLDKEELREREGGTDIDRAGDRKGVRGYAGLGSTGLQTFSTFPLCSNSL